MDLKSEDIKENAYKTLNVASFVLRKDTVKKS